jgi:hypothetical protein
MGKFIRYIGIGLLAAYALHGGCDKNIDDILEDKYSRPIIGARRALVNFASRKAVEAYDSIEKESKNLEIRIDKGGCGK